ncbi:hypothetical protein AVEN_156168-1, partial [Araneus ventricosus]
MSKPARKEFWEWYEERRKESFDFRKEILDYCRSDVDILRRCCLEFRRQFIDVANVDPFCYVTIASACMAVFRSNHIKPYSIAMVPVNGYTSGNFSMNCIRWLDFLSWKDGIEIKYALNGNGEMKIGKFDVDGFCEEQNTIYQYHGCFFHGCISCFDPDVVNPLKDLSMRSLYEKTKEISNILRSKGFQVIEIWEHDFQKMKKADDYVKEFLKTHDVTDRLKPRDAFFGGRTNAIKLYHEGAAKYIDFTSLYPWCNKYC